MSFGYGEVLNSEGQLYLQQLKAGESLVCTNVRLQATPYLGKLHQNEAEHTIGRTARPKHSTRQRNSRSTGHKKQLCYFSTKYLSTDAQRFYQNLSVIDCDNRGNK